jgi:putative membrane protein
MIRFLVATVVNAFGLWLTTLLVPAIHLIPYGGRDQWQTIGSFLLVGAVFGIVNAIVTPVIKVLAFPLYLLTFGLIAFLINGALLLLVAWLSQLIGSDILTINGFTSEGLAIESLGWAILGAVVMSIATFVARMFFKLFRVI